MPHECQPEGLDSRIGTPIGIGSPLSVVSLEQVELDPNAHGPQENEEKQKTWATDPHAALKEKAPRPGLVPIARENAGLR